MWSLLIAIVIVCVWGFISNAKQSRFKSENSGANSSWSKANRCGVYAHNEEAVARGVNKRAFQRIIHTGLCTGAFSVCISFRDGWLFERGCLKVFPQSDGSK